MPGLFNTRAVLSVLNRTGAQHGSVLQAHFLLSHGECAHVCLYMHVPLCVQACFGL